MDIKSLVFHCAITLIVSNLIQGALTALDVTEPTHYRTIHIIAVAALVLPLCMLKSVNSLRYATFVSIGAIAYTAILLVVQFPFFYSGDGASLRGEIEYFKLDWNFFNAFGITFFAFTCQPGFYSALDKLAKRDEDHKIKVAYRSCIINLIFYTIIILAGYLSSLSNTTDVIISRKNPEGFNGPTIVAQILIAGGLCVGIPLNFVPLRRAIFNQVFENPEFTVPRYIFYLHYLDL